jgi:hypothetical protein
VVAGWVVRGQRAVVLAAVAALAAGLSTSGCATHAAYRLGVRRSVLEYESAFSTDAELVVGYEVRTYDDGPFPSARPISERHLWTAYDVDALLAGRTKAPELRSGDVPETLRVGARSVPLSDPCVMVGEVCEPRPDAAPRPGAACIRLHLRGECDADVIASCPPRTGTAPLPAPRPCTVRERARWAYPLLLVGVPAALAADAVMLPVEVWTLVSFLGTRHDM